MLRTASAAALMVASSQALGLVSTNLAEASAESQLILKYDTDGNPRNIDGSKLDIEFSMQNFGALTGDDDFTALEGIEQVLAATIFRIQELEIVFEILEKFPAHCTCCLGKPEGSWTQQKTPFYGLDSTTNLTFRVATAGPQTVSFDYDTQGSISSLTACAHLKDASSRLTRI